MSMTSREQFEQAIKARFGDSIDYRICKNSDGEYMAWDMQVAWWAWQAASKASEQQFAAVVAENVGLKSKGREVLNEACKVYEKLNATISSDSGDFIDGQTLHEFQFLLDVETPATDAYLAEVRAQGVEMFAHSMAHHLLVMEKNGEDAITKIQVGTASRLALAFAAQLRQGVEQ